MPTQAQIEDEVLFWLGQQEREHMLFLALGLHNPAMRSEAARLLRAYEEAAQRRDVRALLALSGPSQTLKREALAETSWNGWIYPSMVEHMIAEIDFALARTRRELSARDVACFWSRERSESAASVAKFLDPKETQLTMQLMRHHAGLRDLHAACRRPSMGNLSLNVLQATASLERLLQSPELAKSKSILHPTLLQHEINEGQRAQASLQGLYLPPT